MALIKCTDCGQEVSDNAPACPHCGNPVIKAAPPAAMPTSKSKSRLWPILFFVLCIGIATFILSNDTLSKGYLNKLTSTFKGPEAPMLPSTPPTRSVPQAPAVTQPPALPPGTFYLTPKKIGEVFIVNGIEYVINSADNLGNNLGKTYSMYSNTKNSEGIYARIKFTARNIGKNEASVNSIFYLLDSLERHFDTAFLVLPTSETLSSGGYKDYHSSSGNSSPYGDMFQDKLKPGFSQKYIGFFEIASDSSSLRLIMGNTKDQNFFIPLGF